MSKKRMSQLERREQIIEVASRLLSESGIDGVQITEVATAAGVSRPIVYRSFSNRQDLLKGVLQAFQAELSRRFSAQEVTVTGDDLTGICRAFIDCVCDTIEERGAGPWHLLDSKGPDPDVAEYSIQLLDHLLEPWVPGIAA
ncbi:MAG: TetR/AcrR family transcriptional regulator, partial [Myxococcales bacterium]|nr:TetR/AcrR family transcriptional regulator [Myxococcales bacterium]